MFSLLGTRWGGVAGPRCARVLATRAVDHFVTLHERLSLEPAQWALLLKRYPQLVCERQGPVVSASAVGVVDCLRRELDMDGVRAGRLVLGAPPILGFPVAKVEDRLRYWQDRLQLSRADMRKVLAAYPQALLLRTKMNVEPTLAHLAARFELDESALRALVLKWPPLVGMEPKVGLESRLTFLQSRLQLDNEQLRKLFLARPRIFGHLSHENIEPKLCLLEETLGASAAELRKLVLQAPPVLEVALDTILSRIHVLKDALGLDRDGLRKIIVLHPSIILFGSESKVLPTVRFLTEALGLTAAELRRLVSIKPQVFSYSRQNIQAKLTFFEHEVGASLEQIRAAVLASPPILGLSLANRLRPRLQRLRAQLADAEQLAPGGASAETSAASVDMMRRFRLAAMRTEAARTKLAVTSD